MSSGYDARALVMFMTLLAASSWWVACRAERSEPAVTAAPEVPNVPVGPLPGPAEGFPEPQNPFTNNVQALFEGRRFFVQYNCAGCHGDHGGGGMGPSLRDTKWIYGSTDAQIARSILDGRAHGMPAWQQMLTPAQTWQLTAYIKSMRTPREPQKPPGS